MKTKLLSTNIVAGLETLCDMRPLLDAVRLRPRVRHTVELYCRDHGLDRLSPRQLMDLFLPADELRDHPCCVAPIWKQRQFGTYCYESALLSLSEAELGAEFRTEWMRRLALLKEYELRMSPGNWGRRKKARR